MKKIFLLLICFVAGVTSSFSQEKGDMAAGMHFNYGSELSVGLGAKFQYNIMDQLRLEPEFNYFFKHKGVKSWDMSVNVHYLFPIAKDLVIYPLAGLGYANMKVDGCSASEESFPDFPDDFYGRSGDYSSEYNEGSSSHGEVQFKFGGGAEYRLTESLKAFVETKVQLIDDYNQFVFTTGVVYSF